MDEITNILNNQFNFLKFMKSRIPLIHLSNVFFRDLHYCVMSYFSEHNKRISYRKSEELAGQIADSFEKTGIFKRINHQTWVLNYPEFALPKIEKKTA